MANEARSLLPKFVVRSNKALVRCVVLVPPLLAIYWAVNFLFADSFWQRVACGVLLAVFLSFSIFMLKIYSEIDVPLIQIYEHSIEFANPTNRADKIEIPTTLIRKAHCVEFYAENVGYALVLEIDRELPGISRYFSKPQDKRIVSTQQFSFWEYPMAAVDHSVSEIVDKINQAVELEVKEKKRRDSSPSSSGELTNNDEVEANSPPE